MYVTFNAGFVMQNIAQPGLAGYRTHSRKYIASYMPGIPGQTPAMEPAI